jgi:transcription factor IIIB subunit 2
VATCLYIICRQEKSPHLLIDFSDALQINVYVLGKSFLQFSKVLNLNLPVVDPSLYIHRYATRLDLGTFARLSISARFIAALQVGRLCPKCVGAHYGTAVIWAETH